MQTEDRVKDLFVSHLSPQMVRNVMEEPDLVNLRGEYREMSFLFVDVVDATAAMRALSAEETVRYFNEYFTAVQKVVLDTGGFMDKIIGDAVVAFWGAPLPTRAHASAACTAALGIRDAVRTLSEGWIAEGKPPMRVGIGINTGEALIGNLGSPLQLSYTPLGDAVNLGARMERESRVHDVDVVASEFTVGAAGNGFETREIGAVETKIRPEPVTLYELVASR
jgi:adenylate cyclase